MVQVKSFTFNPFQENSWLVYDEKGHCLIFDPGCYDDHEWLRLRNYIEAKGLRPERLINTHCHLDHIFGNHYLEAAFDLEPECSELELPLFDNASIAASMYGVELQPGRRPSVFLNEGDRVSLGAVDLQVMLTPGHSPGSLSFYNERDGWLIAGDVLFYESIGRSDLPGGDHGTLLRSIMEKLMVLPDDTVVHCGHGPSTTIGHERRRNPFLVL